MAKLSACEIGDIVKLNMKGVATDFIVVHKGLPSTKYSTSCDGVWLLMKDVYVNEYNDLFQDSGTREGKFQFMEKGGEFNYEESYLYEGEEIFYDVLNDLDLDISQTVLTAEIPYWKGNGVDGSLKYSTSIGLRERAFLLSYNEVNGGTHSGNPGDGAVLSYFAAGDNASRIAYYNGEPIAWITRSPEVGETQWVYEVQEDGSVDNRGFTGTSSAYVPASGIRPAIILPYDLYVKNGFVLTTSPFSGSATIDGVSKELSGAHVNIDGTWKEVSEAHMNIGGVWKPMA